MDTVGNLKALVTGAASGIGLATARRLVREGAVVAALDRDPVDLPGVYPLVADLTDDAAVRSVVDGAAHELGGLDLIANIAGIGAQGGVADNDDAEWMRVLDVNVVGMVRVIRAALPFLRRSPHAAVVNTGSVAACAGLPQRVLYSASKGAVQAASLAMAADLISDGVRVNVVQPGTTDTPWVRRLLDDAADPSAEAVALASRQPIGRLVSADEVAAAIVYLLAPAAGSTTGSVLPVDGGMYGLRVRTGT